MSYSGPCVGFLLGGLAGESFRGADESSDLFIALEALINDP